MQQLLRSAVVFILWTGMLGPLSGLIVYGQEALVQKVDVPDEALEAFAKAYVELEKIQLAYEPSLRDAQEQTNNIQKEASVKIETAMEEQGLTKESFVWLYRLINTDDQLRAKALKMIDTKRQNH